MTKNLEDLKHEINAAVHNVHYISQDIIGFEKLLNDPESPHKLTYEEAKEQMDDIISEYIKAVRRGKILLECYFAEEAKAGLPSDLLFRRIYSKLKKAL